MLFILPFVTYLISSVYGQEGGEDYFKREHSLTKPYQGSGWQIPNWDFFGSTIISNDYIRITPDARSSVGGIWNSVPIMTPSWEIHMQFKIHGGRRDLFGDGMVLWYAKDRMVSGPVFGSKDFFMGLAIIIDTYSNHNGPHNHQHPYISGMINNSTLHYDHDRDGTLTQLAGCEVKVRNLDHNTYISVRYDNEILTVSTDLKNENKWTECFSIHGIVLPIGYYIGVTAATGDLSDNHDLIAIRTYEIGNSVLPEDEIIRRQQLIPSSRFTEPLREHVPDPVPTSYFKVFMYFLVAIIVIVALVILGVILYQNHQNNSRKRFY